MKKTMTFLMLVGSLAHASDDLKMEAERPHSLSTTEVADWKRRLDKDLKPNTYNMYATSRDLKQVNTQANIWIHHLRNTTTPYIAEYTEQAEFLESIQTMTLYIGNLSERGKRRKLKQGIASSDNGSKIEAYGYYVQQMLQGLLAPQKKAAEGLPLPAAPQEISGEVPELQILFQEDASNAPKTQDIDVFERNKNLALEYCQKKARLYIEALNAQRTLVKLLEENKEPIKEIGNSIPYVVLGGIDNKKRDNNIIDTGDEIAKAFEAKHTKWSLRELLLSRK